MFNAVYLAYCANKQLKIKSEVYFTADVASKSAIDLPCVCFVDFQCDYELYLEVIAV